jgi:hypothetical protein
LETGLNLPSSEESTEINAAQLQKYQSIYRDLTDRPERKLTFKSDRHRISIDHIKSLHRVIEQTAHAMTVIASSCEVTQRLADASSERWSGMEKFRAHGAELTQVTTDIQIIYNFLIKLPHADKPGQYKITIAFRNELHSLDTQRKDTAEVDEVELIILSRLATARWEIEFTDMSVGRMFSHSISKWYEGLPLHPTPLAERIIKYNKPYIPAAVRLVSASIIAYTIFGAGLWNGEGLEPGNVALFIFILYGAHFVTTPLLQRLERKMSYIRTAASLEFTGPDKELVRADENSRGSLTKWIWVNAMSPQIPAVLIFMYGIMKNYY